MGGMESEYLTYKPSAFYFRQELRNTRTKKQAVAIGMHLVSELELLKQFVRDLGHVPPKWNVMRTERLEKGWGVVVPFETATPPDQQSPAPGDATTSE